MESVHEYFTTIDWIVIVGYLLLTTFVGHLMRGKQGTIRDFFLGGKSLPWPAVSGSMIATEISGVTFIGVPATLFYLDGDMTYMMWGIGAILARIIVGLFFVKYYYQQEVYSPYDFMGLRLGNWAKSLATILFTLGSILGQSVRVMVAAIPLNIVTNLGMFWCIIIIGLFAVVWTLMGGMRTVIWTDVMQFFLFAIGGTIALIVIIVNLPEGTQTLWETGSEFGRDNMWDGRFGFDKDLKHTFWVACFAVPFLNLGNYGVDQLNAQRMFCCKNQSDATKAIIFSSVGQILTLLMLFVGMALFVHYHHTGFSPDEMKAIGVVDPPVMIDGSNIPKHSNGDAIFPVWIVKNLPAGVSGLILAGVFAAAISSLDSILAALSQTTLSMFTHPEKTDLSEAKAKRLLLYSKGLVIGWGIILTVFTMFLYGIKDEIQIVPLAFGLTAYTVGPLLALLILSILKVGNKGGIVLGVLVAITISVFWRKDLWLVFIKAGFDVSFLDFLPTYEAGFKILKDGTQSQYLNLEYHFSWLWPITFFVVLGFGKINPTFFC